jgi:hypothetical protein
LVMLALVIQELVLVSTTGAIIDPLLHQIHLYISGAGGPYLRIAGIIDQRQPIGEQSLVQYPTLPNPHLANPEGLM